MKILHVIFSLQIGGSETMLVDILNEQVETSHSVKLIIINNNYNPELIKKINSKVEITRLGRRKGYNSLWVGLKINLFVMKEEPDVIHFHDHTGINYLLNKKKFNTVLTVHNVGIDSQNWHKYTTIAAISETVQKEIFDRTGIQAVFVYNGIKLSSIRKREQQEKGYKLVQVGRLAIEKNGQDVLLKAFSLLQKKYTDIPFSLDLIGEGDSLAFLQKLVVELDVRNVSFLGAKDREYIYNKLADYNLLIQPSNYEGFGLVIAEALAANIQVLVSATDAAVEVIKKGRYGMSFSIGSDLDCFRQLEKILIQEEYTDMTGLNEYLAENFDIRKTASNYIDLYETLIAH